MVYEPENIRRKKALRIFEVGNFLLVQTEADLCRQNHTFKKKQYAGSNYSSQE
ncbi:hypothetical protein SanJ4206_0600c [Streptococcus anginosus]|nr:hypothetical protein SanJ4206_0600c [Streptococcus anginosus]